MSAVTTESISPPGGRLNRLKRSTKKRKKKKMMKKGMTRIEGATEAAKKVVVSIFATSVVKQTDT